jgi:hypothetical protein
MAVIIFKERYLGQKAAASGAGNASQIRLRGKIKVSRAVGDAVKNRRLSIVIFSSYLYLVEQTLFRAFDRMKIQPEYEAPLPR